MLQFFLFFLLALFLIISYILLVPVVISFSVDSSLSGDLRIKFFPFDIRIDRKKGEKAKKEKKKKKAKNKRIDFKRLLFDEFGTISQVLIVFWKSIAALFKSRHHSLHITLRGGLGAPDITGFVSGMIEAVRPALGKRVVIACYPDMTVPSPSGTINIRTVFRVYRVLAEVPVALFRLPMLRIVNVFIKITKGEYHARTT